MPTFLYPPGLLPCFLIDGHAFLDDSVYSNTARGTGHMRKRRIWTEAQRTYDVSWLLTGPEMSILDEWFEDVLLAGQRRFIARVQTEDGIRYWEAIWIAPYSCEPIGTPQGVHWRVTGRLLMFGDATAEAPLSGLLAVEYGLELISEATIAGASLLSAEYGLALEDVLPFEAEYGLDLEDYDEDSDGPSSDDIDSDADGDSDDADSDDFSSDDIDSDEIDSDATDGWLWENGTAILWEDGTEMELEA